jgi:hypothetical protein
MNFYDNMTYYTDDYGKKIKYFNKFLNYKNKVDKH